MLLLHRKINDLCFALCLVVLEEQFGLTYSITAIVFWSFRWLLKYLLHEKTVLRSFVIVVRV